MKNTKEITTGAMLLAIYGALLIIDRQFSFFFIEIIALAVPVLIIMFGNIYNLKDGIYFSIALLIIAFIFSPYSYTYFYIPVGVIVGNAYNYLLYKGIRSKIILLITIVLYAIFDLLYAFIISPIFLGIGFDVLIKETGEMLKMLLNAMPVELNIDFNKFTFTLTFASLLVMSVMEGIITHILVIFLFRRFKINKDSFNAKGILMITPLASYILLLGSCLAFIAFRFDSDMVTSILFAIGAICMYVLIYYGYVYAVMFSRIRLNRRPLMLILIILLLIPYSLLILLIIGFLYGTGPLKKFLVKPQGGNNEKN